MCIRIAAGFVQGGTVLIIDVTQNNGTADHADENVAVVDYRDKVLVDGRLQQAGHVGGDGYGLIIAAAGETGNRHILAGFEVQAVQVLHAPQNVSLGDGADILAVAFQHGDRGKALVGLFFQRLAQGEILVNIQNILLGGQEKQKIHAKWQLLWQWNFRIVLLLVYTLPPQSL